ncbi:MAG: hypothetical protein IPG34_10925 [Rhodocyclaceae bacterium]|nr:hypothetical protein [Rhodocyclaceae bacterium]
MSGTLTIADYLKFANLQMAAESLFDKNAQIDPNVTPGSPYVGPINPSANGRANLEVGNERASRFTKTQVEYSHLADDWTVDRHISNTKTGFSGTLFRHTATNELVLSFRSTEFADDAARDTLQADSHEMANLGLALGQIDDMEAWYASLKTSGLLPEGARYSVTGYSLGGHLASAFNLLRHEDNSAGQIEQVVTFNGAGIGRFSEPLTKIMADFRDLRDAASTTDELVDRLSSTAGKKLYRELHSYALTHGGALPLNASIRINELSKVVAPNEANELLKDENLLRTALTQVRAVVNLATTVSAVPSGSEGSDNPANIPTTSIAGASFDYQLATLLIEKRHVIDNRGKIGMGWDTRFRSHGADVGKQAGSRKPISPYRQRRVSMRAARGAHASAWPASFRLAHSPRRPCPGVRGQHMRRAAVTAKAKSSASRRPRNGDLLVCPAQHSQWSAV